jgi:mycoredoxin
MRAENLRPMSGMHEKMRLKGQLAEREISFEEVGIEHSPEAAVLVESLNHGNQMVPTRVFSDGTSMANPSEMAFKENLSAL